MTPFTDWLNAANLMTSQSADVRKCGGEESPRNHTDEIAMRLSRWRARVRRMCTRYDPQREAEAAMRRAAESEGADRQRLIQLALAWHELARDRRDERAD